MLTVCIPSTANCYDLLERCIISLLSGTIKPSKILVCDNGGLLKAHAASWQYPIEIYTPPHNLGVAATWNWFVAHTEGRRIITNDDIEFAPNTLAEIIRLLDEGHDFVYAGARYCGYSCFAVTDKMMDTVGPFDENISPGYAYYEDNDFDYRLHLAGFDTFDANTPVIHIGSATLKRYDASQQREHWRKFELAKANYKAKWGGEPGHEIYTVPHPIGGVH